MITQRFINYSQIEKDYSILKQFSYVLIEYNNSIYNSNKMISQEILESSINALKNQDESVFLAFNVLIGYFNYFYDYFQQLKEVLFLGFDMHLYSKNKDIQCACAISFCNMISIIDTPDAMYFGQLLPSLLKAALSLYDNETLFIALRDVAESEPLFFKKKINFCIEFVSILVKICKNPSICYLGCDFLSAICINSQEMPKESIGQIIELVRSFMKTINIQLPDTIEIDYLDLASELISKMLANHMPLLKEFIVNTCGYIKSYDKTYYMISLLQINKIIKYIGNDIPIIANILEIQEDEYSKYLTISCIRSI